MNMLRPIGCAAIVAAAFASAGAAEASVCQGAAPQGVLEIRGPVLHVPDGERICVALSPDPADWVELQVLDRIAEGRAGEARGALMAASFGQDVTCRIMQSPAGAAGVCRTSKGDVARLADTPRIIRTGLAWR